MMVPPDSMATESTSDVQSKGEEMKQVLPKSAKASAGVPIGDLFPSGDEFAKYVALGDKYAERIFEIAEKEQALYAQRCNDIDRDLALLQKRGQIWGGFLSIAAMFTIMVLSLLGDSLIPMTVLSFYPMIFIFWSIFKRT